MSRVTAIARKLTKKSHKRNGLDQNPESEDSLKQADLIKENLIMKITRTTSILCVEKIEKNLGNALLFSEHKP